MENATIKLLQREVWLNNKGMYMKDLNMLAGNLVNNFLRRDIWLNTKGQYMKESSILAENAIIKQPKSRSD